MTARNTCSSLAAERDQRSRDTAAEAARGRDAALREREQHRQREQERLREQVEALQRAAKRQAAPFSKSDPAPTPKWAGRKPGAAHGRHGHRQPPTQVGQVVAVGLPAGCPGCGGELMVERVAAQSVEELPVPRPLRIRYDYIIVAAIAQRGPFRFAVAAACCPAGRSLEETRLKQALVSSSRRSVTVVAQSGAQVGPALPTEVGRPELAGQPQVGRLGSIGGRSHSDAWLGCIV